MPFSSETPSVDLERGTYARWIASHQHYELEKLRIENPERYRLVYMTVFQEFQRRETLER